VFQRPPTGDGIEPSEQLAVEVLEVAEAPAHEEAVAQVAERAFELALALGAVGSADARREAVPAGEVEQAGLVARTGARALEDDHLGVDAHMAVRQLAGGLLAVVEEVASAPISRAASESSPPLC